MVQILSFRSYGVVGFILFPKSPTAQDSESSSESCGRYTGEPAFRRFLLSSLDLVEPIRVEILEFPVWRTKMEDECVILKFCPLRFSDSEPWDPIFLSLPCTKALDPEGEEEES